MKLIDDFKLYLPKYLTPESERDLFEGLNQFPANIHERFYTTYRRSDLVVYQGDGIKDLLIINLPKTENRLGNGMIVSNTCDIDLRNPRINETRVCYSPIMNLKKYKDLLSQKLSGNSQKVDNHINRLKRQEISHIFYLPKGGDLKEESFIFLDRIINCANSCIDRIKIKDTRLFTLGNLGFYIFLFKLSVHFTRVNEKIDRDELEFKV
jgi:hypothetical protein